MTRHALPLILAAFFAMMPTVASADTISLLGDKDCFGLGGSCPDGALFRDGLGGFFFANNQGVGDPAFTDNWSTENAVITYSHTYVLDGAATGALLDVLIAGIHDINTGSPYNVLFNGVLIGAIPSNLSENGFQEVLTYQFAVPTGLLTGADVVSWAGTAMANDGFIVDHSELRIATTVTAVPELTTLTMIGAGLTFIARRRRRAPRL